MSPSASRGADLLRQTVAGVVLLIAVVGVPAALGSLVGWPLPGDVGAVTDLGRLLGQPLPSGAVVDVLAIVAWLAWAHFTVGVVVELVNATARRGRPQLRLPFGGASQDLARALVVTLLLAGATAPLAVAPPAAGATDGGGPGAPAVTAPLEHPGSGAGDRLGESVTPGSGVATLAASSSTWTWSPVVLAAGGAAAGATELPATATATAAATGAVAVSREYVVATPAAGRYDCLWRIAEDELGDGTRWVEIWDLNAGRAQADGQTVVDPDLISPGWRLQLPADATHLPAWSGDGVIGSAPAPSPGQGRHVVAAGDTLWDIAEQELGDGARYPELATGAADVVQADGQRLRDPDVIQPGWVIPVPGTSSTPVLEAAAADPPAPDSPTPAAAPAPAPETLAPDRVDEGTSDPAAIDPAPAGPQTAAAPDDADAAETGDAGDAAAWLVLGLSGAGTMLAAAMLMLLRRHRRWQARARRPGRAVAVPAADASAVERSVLVSAPAVAVVERLDELLRRTAGACAGSGDPPPRLRAVSVHVADVVLHLDGAAFLPAPWDGTPDGLRWTFPADAGVEQAGSLPLDQPAPYPLLVTVGADDHGATWLLNLEALGTVRLAGGVDGDGDGDGGGARARALVRHVAAELACTAWADDVRVECVGVAEELAAMNPDRLRVGGATGGSCDAPSDVPGADVTAAAVVADVRARATALLEDSGKLGVDVPTARALQAGERSWPARVLLVGTSEPIPALDELSALVHAHPGRTGTVVLRLEDGALTADPLPVTADGGPVVRVDAAGRLHLPGVDVEVTVVGLSSTEARGCAALYAVGAGDTAMPVDAEATDGWRAFADEAGSPRAELTEARTQLEQHGQTPGAGVPGAGVPGDDGEPDVVDEPVPARSGVGAAAAAGEEPAGSVLPAPDEVYVDVAATTTEDLASLAPRVPVRVRDAVADADPDLDEDVRAWFADSCVRPRLRLLGPVEARARGVQITKRKPYFTELLAYLATRPHGATPEEVAAAFDDISLAKVRGYVNVLRDWLGTNPRTGVPFLPDARKSAAYRARGVGAYQVEDLLLDVDLFRRLRLRGTTRGPAGIRDLQAALSLVAGPPFSKQRPGGWTWLAEGDRLDQHMLCAVVDVAHLVTTHLLQVGDFAAARATAELAAMAAPEEEIPRLDLAAVAAASGHDQVARDIVLGQVCTRSDDDGPPEELSERTQQIIDRHGWLTRDTRAAS